MRRVTILLSLAVLIALLTTALVPTAASADSRSKKNLAIGLGAAAIYSAVRGWTLPALALGAGTVYTYNQAQRDHRYEQSWNNRWNGGYGRYQSGRSGYGASYETGRRDARRSDRDRDRDWNRGYQTQRPNWGRGR